MDSETTCGVFAVSKEDSEVEGRAAALARAERLNQFVDEHYRDLFKYAFRYLGRSGPVEDIVQETFLAAAGSLEDFDNRASPRSWLTGILRNKIVDYYRAKQRTMMPALPGEPDRLMTTLFDEVEHWKRETGPLIWGGEPEAVLRNRQFVEVLDSCLARLPSNQRHIFLLVVLDGISRADVAQEFNLSPGNVGVVLHRARLALQHCLQEKWFLGEE